MKYIAMDANKDCMGYTISDSLEECIETTLDWARDIAPVEDVDELISKGWSFVVYDVIMGDG